MAAVPFASLSVHNFISSVGADAGFASVIGLAILTLLYFAHARETSSLRDEAAGLAQRLQEAEARLAEARAQAVVAEALPAPAAGVAAAPGVGPIQLAPAAPAGLGAPALAAATRFIPAGTPSPSPVRKLTAPAVVPAPAPAPAPIAPALPAVASAAAATIEAPVGALAEPADRPVPASAPGASRLAPATVAGGANGASSPPRAPAPQGSAPPQVVAAPPRPTAPGRSPFVTPPPARRSSASGRRFLMLVGALILIGAAAAVVIVTSGTGSSAPPAHSRVSNAPNPAATAFDPSHVTVAVLNGTATNQLAHHIAARLSGMGYQKGVIATASNQSVSSTVVAYLPGSSNRLDAVHVARALGLHRGAVQPINNAAQAVACPPPNTCTANVVVTVGTDLSGA